MSSISATMYALRRAQIDEQIEQTIQSLKRFQESRPPRPEDFDEITKEIVRTWNAWNVLDRRG